VNTIRKTHITIMSFEITATIANFGGKLLKLAHQVNTQIASVAQHHKY
jgi:hypothetical protein